MSALIDETVENDLGDIGFGHSVIVVSQAELHTGQSMVEQDGSTVRQCLFIIGFVDRTGGKDDILLGGAGCGRFVVEGDGQIASAFPYSSPLTPLLVMSEGIRK